MYEPEKMIDHRRCHREFPNHDIEECADKLRIIAEAQRHDIGGEDGSARLLVDAINAAWSLERSLFTKAVELGILGPDALGSH